MFAINVQILHMDANNARSLTIA